MLVVFLCFFFKQKTAYEMRISDWSSDVCSSDLRDDEAGFDEGVAGFRDLVGHSFPAFQPAFRQNVGWVGFINPAAWGAGSVELTQPTAWLAAYLTRETYSPERVSTLITSSWPTNSGTRTTAPVSSVAGLPPPPAVSPRTPGSVSVIFSST